MPLITLMENSMYHKGSIRSRCRHNESPSKLIYGPVDRFIPDEGPGIHNACGYGRKSNVQQGKQPRKTEVKQEGGRKEELALEGARRE
ncbi:polycystin-1 [Plakobranchus ocellatus]|uniref:Polycystin-1 n=1 Tax=Plakobranchus ocellatus TaxID=259542 RepID=A0AAV3YGW7_9GAST|nr:polycystin-1 [Plakobranchus ocellatus]